MVDFTNDTIDRDDELDRLLLDVIRSQSSDVAWPSDEVIHAYVTGACTEAQRDEVLSVMAQSSAFRRFIVDTTLQIQELQSAESRAAFDDIATRDQKRTHASIVDSLWDWLPEAFSPRVLAPVLGVVAVVTLALLSPISRQSNPIEYAFVVEDVLNREIFGHMTKRGAESGSVEKLLPVSAHEAAVKSLQNSIYYTLSNDRFHFKPSSDSTGLTAPTTILVLDVVRPDREVSVAVTFEIPKSLDDPRADVQAWLLAPPSMRLWQVDVDGPHVTLTWPDDNTLKGYMTITYRDGTVFQAAPVQEVVVPHPERQSYLSQ